MGKQRMFWQFQPSLQTVDSVTSLQSRHDLQWSVPWASVPTAPIRYAIHSAILASQATPIRHAAGRRTSLLALFCITPACLPDLDLQRDRKLPMWSDLN